VVVLQYVWALHRYNPNPAVGAHAIISPELAKSSFCAVITMAMHWLFDRQRRVGSLGEGGGLECSLSQKSSARLSPIGSHIGVKQVVVFHVSALIEHSNCGNSYRPLMTGRDRPAHTIRSVSFLSLPSARYSIKTTMHRMTDIRGHI
jgi:hypothetical protein